MGTISFGILQKAIIPDSNQRRLPIGHSEFLTRIGDSSLKQDRLGSVIDDIEQEGPRYNVTAARAMGIKIPESFLSLADEVVE